MDLSILIASFDWDVTSTVKHLHLQASKLSLKFEILISDNCSHSIWEQKNAELNTLPEVTYRVENEQVGRAANRNHLAQSAKGNWLLFLDADAEIHREDYLEKYWYARKSNTVFCGGTFYKKERPQSNFMLRYKYGIQREEIPANIRNQHPWKGFSAFNFLIEKQVFLNIKMNDSLIRYGHEDTLFGEELRKRNIPIVHLNNSLIHLGLDSNDDFLKKTEEGIKSLVELVQQGVPADFTKLSRTGVILQSNKIQKQIFQLFWKLFGSRITNRLHRGTASMREFDLYKLHCYLRFSQL